MKTRFNGRGLAVIIPAYNEQDCIAKVIEDIRSFYAEAHIIVVNDGSKDNTAEVARRSGQTTVIDLPINLGIGGAVQAGFKLSKQTDAMMAIQFDGDGQHIAQEIECIIEPVVTDQADVVIGSRFISKRGGFKSTRIRRIGIKIIQLLNTLITGRKITDCTSGFRAYNKKAILFLAENYPDDYPEPEAVILLGRNGFRIKEVPCRMRIRKTGKSSIRGFFGIYYMIKVILAMVVTAMRRRVVRE